MKKILSLILVFCLAFSAILFCGCNEKQPEVKSPQNINIVAFGDSISAGYGPENSEMYSYYNNYAIGRNKINEKCFSYVLTNSLCEEEATIKAVGYAESGDTTDDLIDKLNDKKNYPDLLTDISRADIITLCIGANNVLAPTLNNMMSLMSGMMSLQDYEAILQTGYENFKDDYTNSIIPVLTRSNAQIYVMTIYDPYKYASFEDITVTGSYSFDVTQFESEFFAIKNLAITYLNKINNYIKSQIYDNVFVVDVNASFEGLTKAQYSQYLNIDTTKITLNINSAYDILGLQQTLLGNIYFDPHPTIMGHQYIASLYLDAIEKNNQSTKWQLNHMLR